MLFDLIIAIVILGAWLILAALIVRGWRNRGHRQTDVVGEIPAVPADVGDEFLGPDTGLYLGATLAPSWQNRIAVGDFGDRAAAALSGHDAGILITRSGASQIWIPRASLTAVRTERGHAGKVMSRDGVIVFRWLLPNGTEVDSGFRADDKSIYARWIAEYEPRDRDPEVSSAPAVPDEQRKDQ
ncbi:MAG: transporter [Gordonia sp. (in: high G+C Gram-positive bacteria)]